MTKKVILLKGLPGAGKSTWAREQVQNHPGQYKIVSTDDLRAMLDAGKWSKANEKFMLEARDALILLALRSGYYVIVDALHLHPRHESHIRELVKGLAVVEIKNFTDVPLETCIKQDLQRTKSVGESVIRSWHRDYLQPKPVIPAYDPSLPDAIICDLDGTLALLNGRNSYDASTCEQDLLNEPIAGIIENDFSEVILVSGRSEVHRTQTENWLRKEGIRYHALFMRQANDNRKDAIIKREIYDQHIADKYNVKYVLDDRKSVVEVWRSLGLLTLQVAEGDF